MNIIKKSGKIYIEDETKELNLLLMKAPTNFSIINNTNEVVSYFNQVNAAINAENFHGILVFELEGVKNITADAVMYMNAMAINSLSANLINKAVLHFPKSSKCKGFLKRCGLGQYLSDKKGNLIETDKYYTIIGGKKADVDRIREIGLFTMEKLGIEKKDLDFITSSFVELMNNTEQHAYDKNMDKLWYVFIEDTKKTVKYTFLDTGKGIPETMRKTFIDDFIPIAVENHSYFIFEALKGNVPRSSTAQVYRNTGLPEIYRYYREGKLSKLKIISCRGICEFFDSNRRNPKLLNMNTSFCGTLFTWEVEKL